MPLYIFFFFKLYVIDVYVIVFKHDMIHFPTRKITNPWEETNYEKHCNAIFTHLHVHRNHLIAYTHTHNMAQTRGNAEMDKCIMDGYN